MAIVISGVNNNDKITASDGTIDLLSGVTHVGVLTAPGFSASGNITAGHINIGSGIQLGNAGVTTATTFVGNLTGNVTGNVNATSNLLLQIGGSEKFRVGSSGQLGIGGANYGTSGQVLTSGGSGSAATWSTINSDVINEGNTKAEVIDSGSDGRFIVETDGSQRLRVDSNGVSIVTKNTSQRNAGVSTATGTLIFNTTTDSLEFYTGSTWVATNLTPSINSITGTIYNAVASNLVINATNITSTVSIRYSNNSSGSVIATDSSPSISGSNITSTVPAAVYGTSQGTVVKIEVLNADGTVSSNSVTRTIAATPTLQYLVVAGGGGGGGQVGGGGGAGGMLTGSINYPATGIVFTATVGAAGVGQASGSSGIHGSNGSNSSLSGTGLSVTSIGGGGGGGYQGNHTGANGGSGGGGGNHNKAAGSGTSGQGNNGGISGPYWSGGGGGGAGAAGQNSTSNSGAGTSGDGGDGAQSSITGTATYYAGGGGGCNDGSITAGGQGGGGNGGWGTTSSGAPPTVGGVNTGGGGGGSRDNPQNPYIGMNGGSGVVIIRVLTALYSGTTSGSPTVTTDGDYKVIKFTGNGSYTS